MSVFARIEAFCARAVERTFALAFPSALEPVHIARKLVAAFESGANPGRGGRRFIVRMSAADFARLADDRSYLERQWSTMLLRLAERARAPQRPPEVHARADVAVAPGTVSIAIENLPETAHLRLRVRKGMLAGAGIALDRTRVVGRDAACDLVLLDPRVSRRHFRIAAAADAALRLEDLASSNGTSLNGVRVAGAQLGLGDVIEVGDSELVVEPGSA